MAKFNFKLETLRRHRAMLEEERQRELAKLLRERMIFEGQIRHVQQTISQSKRDLSDGLVGKVDLDRVSQFARYSGQVTGRAQLIVLKLAGLERRIESSREQLLEATRARKALDLLRDRQFAQWQREEDRKEVAALDELAVQAYARRQMAEAGT